MDLFTPVDTPMIYFILWTLLFLAILVAVPLVISRENKARLAALPPTQEDENGFDEPDDAVPDEGFGEPEDIGEEAGELVEDFGADDDFAAFDK